MIGDFRKLLRWVYWPAIKTRERAFLEGEKHTIVVTCLLRHASLALEESELYSRHVRQLPKSTNWNWS